MSQSLILFVFQTRLTGPTAALFCWALLVQAAVAQSNPISFDLPALLPASPCVETKGTQPALATDESPANSRTVVAKPVVHARAGSDAHAVPPSANPSLPEPGLRMVQVVIPVTGEIHDAKTTVDSMRFDVYWNRVSYPLTDYAPRTQTTASIAGPIHIETSDQQKKGIGVELSARHESFVNGSLNGQWSDQASTKRQYDEYPQHEVLVASGTSHRGTGAFFRFHPSRFESLEGGRELRLMFCVPDHWRCGILQVECQAFGSRKGLVWKEAFEFGRAFVVPVYLQHDADARDAATKFIQAERDLRMAWDAERPVPQESVWRVTASSKQTVPKQWVHYLIQSGDDRHLETYRARLPKRVVAAADSFVASRRKLIELNR